LVSDTESTSVRLRNKAGLKRLYPEKQTSKYGKMIVYCEECGQKNTVPEKDLAMAKGFIRCQFCQDYFQVPEEILEQALHNVAGTSSSSHLVLTAQDKTININERNPKIRIGRHEDCHIRILDRRVSRLHALVEFFKGKYLLIDRSLNGTYVHIEGREIVVLKKDQLVLVNKGVIGIGQKVEDSEKNVIHFNIAVDVNKTLQRIKDAHAHLT
jgi:hypothetical protein